MTKKLIIKARENGPYKIPGTYRYKDGDQEKMTTGSAMALCRCGQAQNKPFCDGTHRQIGFQAPLLYLEMEIPEA